MRKKRKDKWKLPEIDVPEKYQPYKNVSIDRNHPKRECD